MVSELHPEVKLEQLMIITMLGLTFAVWVGMDDGKTILKGSSGASLALPIWVDIMKGSDRLPNIKNGPIAPARDLVVEPVDDEVPRAIPVNDDEIPLAIPAQ